MSQEGPTSNSSLPPAPPDPPAPDAPVVPPSPANDAPAPSASITPAIGVPHLPKEPQKPAAREPQFSTNGPTVAAHTSIEIRDEIRKRHTLLLIALIPAMAVGAVMFGWVPAVNFVITWVSSMFAGTLFKKLLHTPHEPSGYRFGRALSSVLLIGCLPPNLPWWGAIVAGILIDWFSRMVAQFPGWARWFRHISPVVPALALLYLLGPLVIPGVLYRADAGYPILMDYPLPISKVIDPSVQEMLRDPRADASLPPFTWNIYSEMPYSKVQQKIAHPGVADADLPDGYIEKLSKGELPNVDAVSRPSPMAVVRAYPRQNDRERSFDALDGLFGFHSGATLEVHAIALLLGLLLLCINRIIAWRFVLGALLGGLLFGFMTGGVVEPTIWERFLNGVEHILMGGMLLSMFLFAHPVGLKVSNTASWLQGVLLSFLIVIFRRLLWKTDIALPDLTLVAILISAMVLPMIESFTRKHLYNTAPPAAPLA